ncbi:hypothetical protein RCCWILLIS_74 [Rhodobacter phage RcCWillis]|nr:hypothetical protein RCCWILLIS_74 [Rhodobacter phage RcCWillis]
MDSVSNISRLIHNHIWDDVDESLCSHAWRLRNVSRFWLIWVFVFGHAHCRTSFQWHHFDKFHI